MRGAENPVGFRTPVAAGDHETIAPLRRQLIEDEVAGRMIATDDPRTNDDRADGIFKPHAFILSARYDHQILSVDLNEFARDFEGVEFGKRTFHDRVDERTIRIVFVPIDDIPNAVAETPRRSDPYRYILRIESGILRFDGFRQLGLEVRGDSHAEVGNSASW